MKLSEISEFTESRLIGDSNYEIESISYQKPSKKSIVFISDKAKIPSNIEDYGAILTTNEIAKFLMADNVLVSDKPSISFAKLTKIFKIKTKTPKKFLNKNSLPNIMIGENVSIGEEFDCGCNVVIEDNVKIGNNVYIGHNVVIHHGSIIGNNINIDSGTCIGSEGFGNINHEKKWVHIHHLGNVIIEDNVSIGSNCSIDRGTIDNTVIKSGVVIDNQVHIAHNVLIGEDTAIAAKVGIAGSCNIGKRNMIGGMVGILDHINTADDVVITATSAVIKDIKNSGVYSGIMPTSKHSSWKRIAFWISKLDKIVRLNKLKIKS